MNKILHLTVIFSALFLCNSGLSAQNLQFNSVIFNEYEGVSDGDQFNEVAISVTFVVGPNQVFKFTGSGGRIQNNTFGIMAGGGLLINGKLGTPEYLPTGTYELSFMDNAVSGPLSVFFNGILYDIVP
jgi:hypothetical protein